jgi:hypothetical protein
LPATSAWADGLSHARYVCIGETATEADALVETLLPRLLARRQRFAAGRGEAPDSVAAPAPAEFRREQAIAGDPEACVREIERLAREEGVGHLRCVFNGNGTLDPGVALRGMALFGREVLPAIRRLEAAPASPPAPPAGVGFLRHLLVCAGRACAREGAAGLEEALHAALVATGQNRPPRRVRLTRTLCLGPCRAAPVVAAYPEGEWYAGVRPEQAGALVGGPAGASDALDGQRFRPVASASTER